MPARNRAVSKLERAATRCSALFRVPAQKEKAVIKQHTSPAGFRLYPGEELVTVGLHRFLTYYRPPKSTDLPLVIFVPGAGHLARIAYGHPEGNPSDFLAYWLGELGYGVFCVSYPRDDAPDGPGSGDLTVAEWGGLTAEAARRILETHALRQEVIACGWSMGGRIVHSLNAALTARSITMQSFISVAATPAMPGIASINPQYLTIRPSGFLDYRSALPDSTKTYADRFGEDLQRHCSQEGRESIPLSLYKEEFLTETPVSLLGEGKRFSQEGFYHAIGEAVTDLGTFDFSEWPIVGMIVPTSPYDAYHVLGDQARWSYFNTQKILHDWLRPFNYPALSADEWHYLCNLVTNANHTLVEHVFGNHFFFVGERGARKTASAIARLSEATSRLRHDIMELIDGSLVNTRENRRIHSGY